MTYLNEPSAAGPSRILVGEDGKDDQKIQVGLT